MNVSYAIIPIKEYRKMCKELDYLRKECKKLRPKEGHWIRSEHESAKGKIYSFRCSLCGNFFTSNIEKPFVREYCPKCGGCMGDER